MSKINWKLRLQNKTTLVSLIGLVISFGYTVCALLGITPSVDESELTNLVMMGLDILCLVGIVVDPTTSGISDSEQALTYNNPRAD